MINLFSRVLPDKKQTRYLALAEKRAMIYMFLLINY
jgi:hypothetical protein